MKYFALAAALVAFSAPAFACGDKSASADTKQKVATATPSSQTVIRGTDGQSSPVRAQPQR
ncbi:MAG TPA: hypothetical protein VGM26_14895 [Rhizomicrobium sp.]|jgi:hypothetical protein